MDTEGILFKLIPSIIKRMLGYKQYRACWNCGIFEVEQPHGGCPMCGIACADATTMINASENTNRRKSITWGGL